MDRLQSLKNKETEKNIIWGISIILILLGIYTSILLYLANRSLWLDEAMLAYSFNTRSLWDLTNSIFEWNQSAPTIYLYIVKIITIIFGTTETTLRIFSFVAYMGTLILSYKLLDKAFKLKYPILCVAFISNMSILLYYSNEFKPYMNDCFCVLLVLYLYLLFSENKISFFVLIGVYVVILWLSYPTIFFVGGVLIYEFITNIIEKDKKRIYKIIIGGSFILISFVIHYLTWLKPVANDVYMVNFWIDYKFPLIPTSLEALNKIFILSAKLIGSMTYGVILIGYLIVAGVFISVGKRNKYGIVILIGIFLVLLASFIGKYPFCSRLMLFIYPILAFFIFIALDTFMDAKTDWAKRTVVIGLIIAVFLSNYKSVLYLNPSGRYKPTEEANKLIEYMDEKIEENQILYVYNSTVPVFSFKNGYDNLNIGKNINKEIDNIIFGEHYSKGYKKDIETLLGFDESYILMSHYTEERVEPLMEALNQRGFLELVKEEYDTPLYFYSNKLSDTKTNVKMQLLENDIVGDKGIVSLRLVNDGSAYLNVEGIDKIYITSKLNPDFKFKLEETNIKPGEEILMTYEFEWPDSCNMFDIQLVNNDKYWFEELGVEIIRLYR